MAWERWPRSSLRAIGRGCSSWSPPAATTALRALPSSGCCWPWTLLATLDALSAQRHELDDRLGVQAELLAAAEAGTATSRACSFGALVGATSLPVVARAHALHLLWHRRLGVDLAQP